MSVFTDDAYNKYHAGYGAGTLIGNWHEEQVIREVTGEGRTVPQRHLPRSGLLKDWTKTPNAGPRKMDNTFERVYGPTSEEMPMSTYKAGCIYEDDSVEKTGPKEKVMQARRMEEAERLVQAEEAVIEEATKARHFAPETRSNFAGVSVGEPLAHLRKNYRDSLLQGSLPNPAIAADNEGISRPPNVHYSNQEAVTFHRMALADPALKNDLKVSAAGGVSAFGRSSAFTKPMGEYQDGHYKDETLDEMYGSLKDTNAMRTLGGSQPRGGNAFAAVPSLTALKEAIQFRIAESLGPHGYVVLRQELFNIANAEGLVSKALVTRLFRQGIGLTTDEVADMALDVYLEQMCTTKGDELRINALMSSLRPALAQKEKIKALDAFQAMNPMGGTGGVGGSVPLEAWLARVQDDSLKEVISLALGATGLPEGTVRVSEKTFLELCADLSPLMNVNAVL